MGLYLQLLRPLLLQLVFEPVFIQVGPHAGFEVPLFWLEDHFVDFCLVHVGDRVKVDSTRCLELLNQREGFCQILTVGRQRNQLVFAFLVFGLDFISFHFFIRVFVLVTKSQLSLDYCSLFA